MNLSSRQHRILADMGISVWARRSSQTEPVAPVQEVQPSVKETQAVELNADVVIVTAETKLGQDQERLLDAMLKAVSLNRTVINLLDLETFSSLNTDALAGKTIFLLGNDVAERLLPGSNLHQPQMTQDARGQWIASFSLSDLLENPVLKAAAWQALKQLKMAL